jgi:Uma2 family endonuclease
MIKVADISQLDLNKTYSYADYLTWQFNDLVELIKGKISLMSPAPNVKHQDVSTNLIRLLSNYFHHKKCRVYAAPFDVRLYDRKKSILANQEILTVVQPDICVICNPDLLDKQGCNGAPDWIIEIVSKSTRQKDIKIKYQLYQEAGVMEYWLVFPHEQTVHQFILDENGRYQLKAMFASPDIMSAHLFPELELDLNDVFESFDDD